MSHFRLTTLLFTIAVSAALHAPATAQLLNQPPAGLKPGDAAPPLSILHWVKGDKVEKFEDGKAYVVEFWATWCGPCIQSIPNLTRLQKKYKDKGLTVIGVSSADRNGVDDVRPFVEKRGDHMAYTVAVDDRSKTSTAYMSATGQSGIPHAFVVDKKGRLAWHGHPTMGLEDVVKAVVAGDFDPAKFQAKLQEKGERMRKLQEAAGEKRWDDADRALDEMAAAFPDNAVDVGYMRFFLTYSLREDRPAAAALGEKLIAGEFKDETDPLLSVASVIANDPNADDRCRTLGLKAAQRCAEIATGDQKAMSLSFAADLHHGLGNLDRAILALDQAIAANTDPNFKNSLETKRLQFTGERDEKSSVKPAPKSEP